MKKFLKIVSSKKRKQHLYLDTGVESTEGQSTSNPVLSASTPDPCPVGCETLFEGAAPIVAE
jgi:hypothetical protein